MDGSFQSGIFWLISYKTLCSSQEWEIYFILYKFVQRIYYAVGGFFFCHGLPLLVSIKRNKASNQCWLCPRIVPHPQGIRAHWTFGCGLNSCRIVGLEWRHCQVQDKLKIRTRSKTQVKTKCYGNKNWNPWNLSLLQWVGFICAFH